MGSICGKNAKRIIPKSKSANLGLQSGQSVNQPSVWQTIRQKHQDTMEPIQQLLLQEEEVVPWDDPKKIINRVTKPLGYKVSKITKSTFNTLNADVIREKDNQMHIFKRNIFQSFEQASNNISYLYNLNKVSTDGLLHFTHLSISLFDQSHLKVKYKNEVFAIDRIIPKYQSLQETLETSKMDSIIQTLSILDQISEALSIMHAESFAYRFLRPESVLQKDKRFYLSNPSFQMSPNEQKIVEYFVHRESDYYLYDIIMFALLLLYMFEPEKFSFDSLIEKRIIEDEWKEITESYREELNKHFNNEPPQMIIALVEMMLVYDKNDLPKMSDIHFHIKNTLQKGIQTNFKNDSFGAFLYYHGSKKLPNVSPWLYFTKANQIHVYNLESNKFHYMKVFKKKTPFKIETDVVYHPLDDKFFFFSHQRSQFILKVYDETHEKDIVSWRREVELFREIKKLSFEDPQLLVVEENETDSKMFILNQIQNFDQETQDSYYTSLIVQFKYQQVENIVNDEDDIYQIVQDKFVNRKCISIIHGPKNYQWRREAFHFYDPHNNYIYCIPDFNNVFQNGIRYSYYDVQRNKGNFKEGLLRFTCASEDLFKQFCRLNFKISKVVFCIEVQHGVYLMKASKNIFVLDFNFKCFYSLASISQLQNHEGNQKKDPFLYENYYEVRNQPFELKCLEAGGKNYAFQSGYLHCLAKKEIETVHCIYQVMPNQACLMLLHCYSLHSNTDLLLNIPKSVESVLMEQIKVADNQYRRIFKQVRTYGCYKTLYQDNEEAYFCAETDSKLKYYLHAVKAASLSDITMLFEAFNQKIKSNIIMSPNEYFTAYEDKQFLMYYVSEEIMSTLDLEIEGRKLNKSYFEPKEMSLLIKIVFRALKELKDNKIEHGNFSTTSLCLTRKGIIKIAGWYVANRQTFHSDLADGFKVIYCLATLQTFSECQTIDPSHELLKQYEGLKDFFENYHASKAESLDELMPVTLKLCRSLMTQSVYFDDFWSKVQAIFWVAYGESHLIVAPLDNLKEPRFLKLMLLKDNNLPFKISKHCMFTFNYHDTIYISGAHREDLKVQPLYEINYNKHKQHQMLPLKRLPDIPYPVLSPSMLFADNKVYIIGGYEIKSNVYKEITNRCFCLNLKTKLWKELANLPIGLYGGTALYCDVQKLIYVFGGISNEVDLTTDKLIYLTYDVIRDVWEVCIDLSFKSPFVNSRFDKPMIDLIAPNMFVSYSKSDKGYFFVEIFELVKAGISLKYKIKDNTKKFGVIQDQEVPAVKDEMKEKKEYKRTLQDDLSIAMYKDSLYVMDEDTNNLHIFKLRDPDHPQMELVQCVIQENQLQIHKIQTEIV